MSTGKILLSTFAGLYILMALIPYGDKTNPPVDQSKTLKAPKAVMEIFKRSCYDCHSNQTKWPWYSYIFPMSWSIADHVKNGRLALNFDKWNSYSEDKRWELLEEIAEKTQGKKMPLPSYLWIHKDAKLSQNDIQTIIQWTQQEGDK